MRYKKYFRKTSLKQQDHGDFFLSLIKQKKPKTFLEIGLFHGVTARNVCELLYSIHGNNFNYIGLDLFEESSENLNEIIPNTNFSNPLKQIYFKFFRRENPYSKSAVLNLLKKFEKNIHLIQGNSNKILKKIDMLKVDYVFLDGGHDYETVKNDLNCCRDVVIRKGTILCDDYNLTYAPGVKKAIDEFVRKNNFNCKILLEGRFAIIQN